MLLLFCAVSVCRILRFRRLHTALAHLPNTPPLRSSSALYRTPTHLLEERGTLDQVVDLATHWFERHHGSSSVPRPSRCRAATGAEARIFGAVPSAGPCPAAWRRSRRHRGR